MGRTVPKVRFNHNRRFYGAPALGAANEDGGKTLGKMLKNS